MKKFTPLLLSGSFYWLALTVNATNTAGLPTQMQRGEYVARTADCMACHTANNQPAYAGGLAIKSPMGTIYSTNITPDKTAGIGDYSLEDFSRAVRQGINKKGQYLYPAMPYPSYQKMSDRDLNDLYVWIMNGIKPFSQSAPETHLTFPFNLRFGLRFWNGLFTDSGPFQPKVNTGAEINRGAYLTEGPGHCGSCHTPRGIAMQEKAYDSRSADYLSGGTLDGWAVPALRAADQGGRGISQWSRTDIVRYLQTGRNQHASVAGEMRSVIQHSTRYLHESDLEAIAAYLKSLPPAPAISPLKSDSEAAKTTLQLTQATHLSPGQQLYLDNCSGCHFADGQGDAPAFPPLDGNELINADNPQGFLTVILQGARLPSTPTAPSQLAMPDFGWRLNDNQLAELATFVRQGWHNDAPAVSPEQVNSVRKKQPPPTKSSRPQDVDGITHYHSH